jgi:general secretion pathway protein H
MLLRHKPIQGFTLIEILVVLVIIGIIISTAVLSISHSDIAVEMEVEMKRIYALITLAREEAILQGQELALTVEPDRYLFESFAENKWQPLSNDKVFRERKLQLGMGLALVVEHTTLILGKKADDEEQGKPKPARIYLLSSGEISPFELILRSADETVQFRIKAGEDGKLELVRPQDLS